MHISMFDVLAEWMSPLLLAYREKGVDIEPAGTRHATITPYGPFTAADGVVLNIAVQNDRQWLLLCGVLGLEQMAADARFATNGRRLANRVEVEEAVAFAVAAHGHDELAVLLDGAADPMGTDERDR